MNIEDPPQMRGHGLQKCIKTVIFPSFFRHKQLFQQFSPYVYNACGKPVDSVENFCKSRKNTEQIVDNFVDFPPVAREGSAFLLAGMHEGRFMPKKSTCHQNGTLINGTTCVDSFDKDSV